MEKRQAHHIFDKSYHPEKAYDLDNGITLCGDNKKSGNACHRAFHTIFMNSYRQKCTLEDWLHFKDVFKWCRNLKKKRKRKVKK